MPSSARTADTEMNADVIAARPRTTLLRRMAAPPFVCRIAAGACRRMACRQAAHQPNRPEIKGPGIARRRHEGYRFVPTETRLSRSGSSTPIYPSDLLIESAAGRRRSDEVTRGGPFALGGAGSVLA